MTQLQKWHGAGNDFVVSVQPEVQWTPELARAVCDRHRGIGADGLLVVTALGDDLDMTLFNADGSVAEMSGNGSRVLVAAWKRSTGDTRDVLQVHTGAGIRRVSLELSGNEGRGAVTMGPVMLRAPLTGTLGVASVGNPHVVVLDQPEWSDAQREVLAYDWAEQLGGANVEFVTVVDRDEVSLRVIERGVGWTLACGTGSCATAAVCHAAGLTNRDVTVVNPGGALRVTFDGDEATLEGPVVFVADVSWSQ
jgi:diaminopimelate epimerase